MTPVDAEPLQIRVPELLLLSLLLLLPLLLLSLLLLLPPPPPETMTAFELNDAANSDAPSIMAHMGFNIRHSSGVLACKRWRGSLWSVTICRFQGRHGQGARRRSHSTCDGSHKHRELFAT